MAGCSGGGNLYSTDVGYLADRHLPRVRNTEVHPDSVRRLSIVENEERIRFKLEENYQQMHLAWSSSFQFASARREIRRPLTYATLWSKELSLAALEADQKISSLPKDKALDLLEKRRKEYQDVLQVDVYWFSGPDGSPITGPGARVQLRDGEGNSYDPVEEESGPLRQANLVGGNAALYRRNIFYFERDVDGRDLLEDVDELRLSVNPTGSVGSVQFQWRWGSEE